MEAGRKLDAAQIRQGAGMAGLRGRPMRGHSSIVNVVLSISANVNGSLTISYSILNDSGTFNLNIAINLRMKKPVSGHLTGATALFLAGRGSAAWSMSQ
jgi:hypothetical protein